ncbi:hypothetical protein BDZ97DRAFT_1390100 [Flammula alnicola]|nr:hypothetical protein BDZ97DRAFT_1390100 [Flammula alnicola]
MAAPPQIDVYAQLPLNVALGTDLNLDTTNWSWVHCLALPLGTLNSLQFSQRPYRWIRHAIGVVVGAEGFLSTSYDLIGGVDYNAALPAESAVLYYHLSDAERRRMFPADPSIGRTHVTSSSSSEPTTRMAEFRNEVAQRDGRKCVLTGLEETVCDAVHLLPHSKGDTYISTYTRGRSRSSTGDDIIQDIDSIRNGLFLNKYSHTALGKDIAFLMTPNFAINTRDIDPTASPAEKRFTVHLFQPDKPHLLGYPNVSSGCPAEIPDTPASPPAILFDAIYAGAVLHHFGTKRLTDKVAVTWKDIFYRGGVMTVADAHYKAIIDERATSVKRTQQQEQECHARYEAHCIPDTFDMLMTLPYIMVPPNELQAMLREAKEKAEAVEQSHVQEKVNSWMKDVTAA